MKISTKGCYGIASTVYIAKNSKNGELFTVSHISKALGFSKIYLEQTFSLLKKAGILISAKGAQGGYQLARCPKLITVFDILCVTEIGLLQGAQRNIEEKSNILEEVLKRCVFEKLNNEIKLTLCEITIHELASQVKNIELDTTYMYFI